MQSNSIFSGRGLDFVCNCCTWGSAGGRHSQLVLRVWGNQELAPQSWQAHRVYQGIYIHTNTNLNVLFTSSCFLWYDQYNHCNYFRDTLWWSMRPSKRRRLPKITWMHQKSVDRPSTLTGVSSLDQRSTRRAAAGGDEVKKDCKILTFKLCIPLLSFECNLICLKRLERMQHHRHRNLANA